MSKLRYLRQGAWITIDAANADTLEQKTVQEIINLILKNEQTFEASYTFQGQNVFEDKQGIGKSPEEGAMLDVDGKILMREQTEEEDEEVTVVTKGYMRGELDSLQEYTDSELDLKEDKAEKGVAEGYASLDEDAKVPLNQLPKSANQIVYITDTVEDTPSTEELTTGDICYEIETGDSYVFNGTDWESLALDEDNIQAKWGLLRDAPSSSIEDIDEAVNKKHSHDNKDLLNSLSSEEGETSFLSGDGDYKEVQWGFIEGAIEDQEDLQAILDSKADETDLHDHDNKDLLDSLTDEDSGEEFLSNDGSYRAIQESDISDLDKYWRQADSDIYYDTGKVAVGSDTFSDDHLLDVNGKIRMQEETEEEDPSDTVATKGYVDQKLQWESF